MACGPVGEGGKSFNAEIMNLIAPADVSIVVAYMGAPRNVSGDGKIT